MLINELKLRNLQISTGNVNTAKAGNAERPHNSREEHLRRLCKASLMRETRR